MPLDGYMSVSEAAQSLGLTRSRVNSLIKEGKIKAVMFGGRWAIPEAQVQHRKAWLQAYHDFIRGRTLITPPDERPPDGD